MPVSWFGLLLFCIGLSAHPDSEYQTHLLILHPSIFVDVFNSIQFKILLTKFSHTFEHTSYGGVPSIGNQNHPNATSILTQDKGDRPYCHGKISQLLKNSSKTPKINFIGCCEPTAPLTATPISVFSPLPAIMAIISVTS
jgi:hypothetical protein